MIQWHLAKILRRQSEQALSNRKAPFIGQIKCTRQGKLFFAVKVAQHPCLKTFYNSVEAQAFEGFK
jgi:hypothetical protein